MSKSTGCPPDALSLPDPCACLRPGAPAGSRHGWPPRVCRGILARFLLPAQGVEGPRLTLFSRHGDVCLHPRQVRDQERSKENPRFRGAWPWTRGVRPRGQLCGSTSDLAAWEATPWAQGRQGAPLKSVDGYWPFPSPVTQFGPKHTRPPDPSSGTVTLCSHPSPPGRSPEPTLRGPHPTLDSKTCQGWPSRPSQQMRRKCSHGRSLRDWCVWLKRPPRRSLHDDY